MCSDPYLLHHPAGIRIAVHPLGACWLSCRVPLADGDREILLGSDDVPTMLAGGSYLGASVGRYAGRIAHARFRNYALDANQPPHSLHGGRVGFSRRLWHIVQEESDTQQVVLRLVSVDGDQGFPGRLTAEVRYALEAHDQLSITYRARSDADTLCNLTNHAYFNLNGGDGDNGLQQYLRIAAEYYQPVGADGIPNGATQAVAGTGFDFRTTKRLDGDFLRDMDQQIVRGYDHSFLRDTAGALTFAAELTSCDKRVRMTMYSDQAALHLYSGQYLGGTRKRDGRAYADCAGIALESQCPPQEQGILLAGEDYVHRVVYRFATSDE